MLGHNSPMRTSAFFFATLALLAALAGCKQDTFIVGGTPPSKIYKTAVSLSPGATEIVSSNIYGLKLVGRTASCNFPNPNSPAEVVMSGVKPNYERIAELKPDIILYDDGLFSEADLAKLKELNIETVAITGKTVDEFEQSLYLLGSKLHGESVMSEYVDRIHSASEAAAGNPPAKELKVAVMMPGKGTEHMIAGTQSFVADEVRKAQGTPVGPDGTEFVAASAESLVSLNPDVIVSAGKADAIEKDPRLQSIAAIKNKRVLSADPDIVLRRGSRVDKLIRGLASYFAGVGQEG